ncbi:M23 family metallopeptidase [Rhodococcus kronopolitis]|uniref:M23 family metallopeptidase n=1 Tax=Rhodococcus kronopolitis TaxID=1460226 RepID=A0ABV9FMT5_9NOCA
MSKHRTSFTTSRFVTPAADDDTTAYSNMPQWSPRYSEPEAPAEPRYTGATSYRSDDSYSQLDSPTQDDSYSSQAFAGTDLDAPARRGGAHRIPTPPSALKGRAAVLAVAAGAVGVAGQSVITDAPGPAGGVVLAADSASSIGATAEPQAAQFASTANAAPASQAPQVLNVADPADLGQFSNLLAKGQRVAEERAAREAAARRPLFALPAVGSFTSHYGSRWGSLHAGVDIANAIGTPIYAVADGQVIDSGPASGFGMWVRLLHADGTITVYGHIDASNVSIGQQVMAGDQIATMGNRGFSTGPHLHFEVHLAGENKIDPLPWLASRGISLGVERD